ncbi:hypothetical protein [Actinoplanes sp. NPDC020271]|uniref:hypothetical protein n=1 Tax=Actinoplanes sp. NPDC020271 TaxID=3363896 RepID=UPI00379D7587
MTGPVQRLRLSVAATITDNAVEADEGPEARHGDRGRAPASGSSLIVAAAADVCRPDRTGALPVSEGAR